MFLCEFRHDGLSIREFDLLDRGQFEEQSFHRIVLEQAGFLHLLEGYRVISAPHPYLEGGVHDQDCLPVLSLREAVSLEHGKASLLPLSVWRSSPSGASLPDSRPRESNHHLVPARTEQSDYCEQNRY